MSLDTTDPYWTKSYAPNVPKTLEMDDNASFSATIDDCLKTYADRTAVQCLGARWSYARLDNDSQAFAAALQALDLAAGARVAIMMPSIPQYLVAMLGVLRAGLIVVNVNPLYTPHELKHQLTDSGAEAIIVLAQFAATLEEIKDQTSVRHVIVTSIGDVFGGLKGGITNLVLRHIKKAIPAWSLPGHTTYKSFVAAGRNKTWDRPTHAAVDTAVLQYTGGTTGVAKGAILQQRNLLAAAQTAGAWLEPGLQEEPKIEKPVFLIPLPLYHVFTLYVTAMGLFKGACCILVPNPRDTDSLCKAMASEPFHLMIGLNTLYAAMASHKNIRDVDFSQSRIFVAGGTATHQATAENWKAMTGRDILEGWGMTETTGAGTCNPYPSTGFNGTIGLPMPSVLISIRDDDGNEVPQGEPGEVWIKGPNVMAGYWQNEAATEASFDDDGYLATGDIGQMDAEGFVKIVDRKKDMILVSGFNVYPNEIEDALSSMDGVAEAACIGVPDDATGEAVKVFVVCSGEQVSIDAIKAHCAELMTNYKRPRHIAFIDELPKSPVGKILRKDLRDL